MSLREALDREVGLVCRQRGNEHWRLRSVRLAVLTRAAQLLGIPFDPIEALNQPAHSFFDRRIVLSPATFQALDTAWCRVCRSFPQNVSNQEKRVREKLFFHAPHYAERAVLSKFVHLLAKRDTASSALKTTSLNKLLAVDGFRGILPHQCRLYVGHLSDRLPDLEKGHLKATRALYESNELLSCGGGTTAAGLVLLALLKVYWKRVGSRMDRDTRCIVQKAEECVRTRIRAAAAAAAEGNNNRKRERKLVKKLASRYCREMRGHESLDALAFRKLIDYGKEALAKYLP